MLVTELKLSREAEDQPDYCKQVRGDLAANIGMACVGHGVPRKIFLHELWFRNMYKLLSFPGFKICDLNSHVETGSRLGCGIMAKGILENMLCSLVAQACNASTWEG